MTFPPHSRGASLVFFLEIIFFFFLKRTKGTFNNSSQGTLPYLTLPPYKTTKIWTVSYLVSVCLARGEASERSILSFRGIFFFFLFKSRHSFRYLKDRGTVEHEVREEKSVCHHLDNKKVSARCFLWSE